MHSNSQQSGFFLAFILRAQRNPRAGKQEVCWKCHKKSQLNTAIFFVYIYTEAETVRKCCHHFHLLLRHSYASWFNITHATFFFTDFWYIISASLKYLLRKTVFIFTPPLLIFLFGLCHLVRVGNNQNCENQKASIRRRVRRRNSIQSTLVLGLTRSKNQRTYFESFRDVITL